MYGYTYIIVEGIRIPMHIEQCMYVHVHVHNMIIYTWLTYNKFVQNNVSYVNRMRMGHHGGKILRIV